MSYTLTSGSAVIRDADGAFIPDDPRNGDRQTYAAWRAAGNKPNPASQLPAAPVIITYLQFRALFTAAENQAIMAAAQTSHAVLDWLLQAVGASAIDLGDPQVKAGLDALAAAGLITSAREAAILANQPPPPPAQ